METAASEIALLDATRSYFDYRVCSLCGIPRITLEGSVEDWEELKSRTRRLARLDLGWWIDALLPILDQFVRAARGDIEGVFWRRLYKFEHTSGGPHVTGWLTAFFPYLTDWSTGDASRRNDSLTGDGLSIRKVLYPPMADAPWSQEERRAVLEDYKDEDEEWDEDDDLWYERCLDDDAHWWDSFSGHTSDMFPSGLARVPFAWEYFERSFDMEFIGGFVGVRQNDDTLEVRPEIGWAVRELD